MKTPNEFFVSLNFQKTLIFAALLMVPHIAFSGVFILPKDALPFLRWFFEIDFIKHSIDGLALIIFHDRGNLRCDEMYCHFRNPETFLKMVETPQDAFRSIIAFPIIFFLVHALTYYNVNKRLKSTNV